MGGGVSLPAIPLSQKQTSSLLAEYETRKADGKTEEEMSAELAEALPAIIIFDQVRALQLRRKNLTTTGGGGNRADANHRPAASFSRSTVTTAAA